METVSARGDDYNGYPVSKGYFGSYSMDGLAIALHSVYHTTSFMAALARCVNLLGDADSTGAITGQLAGAFYGLDGIDKRLITRLKQWDNGEIALRGALLYARGILFTDDTKRKAREDVGLCASPEESGLSTTDEGNMSFRDILMAVSPIKGSGRSSPRAGSESSRDSPNKRGKTGSSEAARRLAKVRKQMEKEMEKEIQAGLACSVMTTRRNHQHQKYFHDKLSRGNSLSSRGFSSGDDEALFVSDLQLPFDSPAEEMQPAKFYSGGLIPEEEAPLLPSSAFDLNQPEPPPRSTCPFLLKSSPACRSTIV
jgi:hypothetical protein